ncbi:MAG: hypothetical protein CBB71_03060 [Rhodopirellula sp. TMED11]|nr:MAG: hypothetical protein CBB71_03060 [Rhodopirellula sp. TMED11]
MQFAGNTPGRVGRVEDAGRVNGMAALDEVAGSIWRFFFDTVIDNSNCLYGNFSLHLFIASVVLSIEPVPSL